MSILTEEDIRAAGGIVHRDGNVFFTNVEKLNQAFLAKLAGMELPEPAFTLNWRDGAYKVTKPNIDSQDCYTAAQLESVAVAKYLSGVEAGRSQMRQEAALACHSIAVHTQGSDDMAVYAYDCEHAVRSIPL